MHALKKTGKALLAIASVILCVVLFASTLATMLVADVKVATNKKNLQNLIRQTISAPAKQTTLRPLSLAAGSGAQMDLSNGDLSGVLVEFAYDTLQEMSGGEMTITLEQVEAFVKDSSTKDFLADKSAGIISDLYTGENTTTISTDELLELVEENKEKIKEHFDLDFSEEKLDELRTKLDDMPALKQIQEDGFANVLINSGTIAPDQETNVEDIKDTWYGKLPGFGAHVETQAPHVVNNPLALTLEIVRFYTTDAMLWLCIGVCALLMGLLFLCAWNKPHKAMIKGGITLVVDGTIFLIPTLIAWLAPATWIGIFSFEPMIGTVSRFILMLTGGVCGAVAGLGIALIAGGIVVKVLMKKKKAAPAAAIEEAPVEEAAAIEEAAAEETPAEEVATEEAPAAEETPAEETV